MENKKEVIKYAIIFFLILLLCMTAESIFELIVKTIK
jgi:hypothetical protein